MNKFENFSMPEFKILSTIKLKKLEVLKSEDY